MEQEHPDAISLGRLLEWASVGLMLAGVLTGVLLGGGSSHTGRMLFEVLVLLAATTTILSMVASGRWRFVPSMLLVIPFALAGLAFLQAFPLHVLQSKMDLPSLGTPRWAENLPNRPALSAAPSASLHMAGWLLAAGLLTYVACLQVRTSSRFSFCVWTLGLALLGSLLVGAFQARENNYKIYAFLSAGSKNLPEFVGDLFGKKSVLGLGGYQRLSSTSDVIDEPSFWYEPTDVPIRLFAGFLDATHWAAAATIMLPLLLAGSVLAANRHRQLGSGGWSASSLGLLAVACGLALGIAFFADLGLATLGAIALVVGCAVFMSAPAVRFGLITRCLLLGMILVGGAAIRISRDGGLPVLKEQALQWKTESKAMLSAFNEHWLTGSGIGSFHVVWPIYRPFPAETVIGSSSLGAILVETGVAGLILIGLGVAYCVISWMIRAWFIHAESRIITGGAVLSLLALLIATATGRGGDCLAVIALAFVVLGLCARGLSGGEQPFAVST